MEIVAHSISAGCHAHSNAHKRSPKLWHPQFDAIIDDLNVEIEPLVKKVRLAISEKVYLSLAYFNLPSAPSS